MSYKLIDQIEDNYPAFTLGKNKDHELFVNGVKTDMILLESATDYELLEQELLEKNLIRIIEEEEE